MNKNLIKTSIVTFAILSSTQLWSFEASPRKELLRDIKVLTKKCTVQIVAVANETQAENFLGYRSLCGTLNILSAVEAEIFVEGEWLTATVTESGESDGGDLNDLTVTRSNGQIVATKTNIASYNSVIVAMAGDTNFKKLTK
jgi:hypothetical protein